MDRSPEVEQLALAWLAGMKAGDAAAVARLFAEHEATTVIGNGADQWFTGDAYTRRRLDESLGEHGSHAAGAGMRPPQESQERTRPAGGRGGRRAGAPRGGSGWSLLPHLPPTALSCHRRPVPAAAGNRRDAATRRFYALSMSHRCAPEIIRMVPVGSARTTRYCFDSARDRGPEPAENRGPCLRSRDWLRMAARIQGRWARGDGCGIRA
jgi:hypothetical protein